eukprot:23466_1
MNLNNSSMLVERKARDDAVGLFEGRAKSLLLAAVSGNAAVTAGSKSDLDNIIQDQQTTTIQTEKSLLLTAVSDNAAVTADANSDLYNIIPDQQSTHQTEKSPLLAAHSAAPAAVPGICLDQLPAFDHSSPVVGCHGAKRSYFDYIENKQKEKFYKPYCKGFDYLTPYHGVQNKNHEWFSTCCAWERDTIDWEKFTCENKYPGMGIEPTTPTTTTPATTTSMTTATSKTNATTNEPTPTPTTPTPTTPTPTTPTPTTLG